LSGLSAGAGIAAGGSEPLEVNEWLTVPGAALLRYGTMPADGEGPGMFAQADPVVVERVLAYAGFVHTGLTDVRLPLTFGADLDEAIDYVSHSGPGRRVLATVPDSDRDAALNDVNDVRAALADHAGPDGVHLNAAIWLVTATRA
jgi:hypothetical protein